MSDFEAAAHHDTPTVTTEARTVRMLYFADRAVHLADGSVTDSSPPPSPNPCTPTTARLRAPASHS